MKISTIQKFPTMWYYRLFNIMLHETKNQGIEFDTRLA